MNWVRSPHGLPCPDIGGDDGAASIATARGADFTLVLPAASVSVAVKLWLPTAKLLAGMFQVPLAFTGAVPMEFVPSNTCIVLFASPVPLKVRVVAVVWPSLVGAVSGENEDIFGCAGAVVSTGGGGADDESIVTAKGADFTLVLPAASVSVAVKLWLPTAKLLAGMFQVPLAFTEAVPMEFVPSNTLYCAVRFARAA